MWRCCLLVMVGCLSSEPLPGEVVATNVHPTRFVTDGTMISWLDTLADGQAAVYGGALADIPLNRLDLQPLGPGGSALAMDLTYLYIADSNGVFRLPRAGGSPVDIAPGYARDIVVDDNQVIWCNEGPGDILHWLPKTTGSSTTIAIPEACMGLVVDADNIYVEAYEGVYAVSRTSAAVRKLANARDYISLYPAAQSPMISFGLIKNGDHLEWMIHQVGAFTDQDRGALIEIPLTGATPTVIVKDLYAPALLRLDSATGTRYWYESEVNHASDRNGIRRLSAGDVNPVDVLMDIGPSDFEIRDGQLYWSHAGADYDYGYIRRMPLP